MTMTTLAVRAPPVPVAARLDHVLLRRAFLVIGLALVFVAPFTPDPVEFSVGAFVPWLVLRIAGTPTMPAALVFFQLFLGSLIVSSAGRFLSEAIPALDQPMEAVARVKIIAMLMLFGGVLSAK